MGKIIWGQIEESHEVGDYPAVHTLNVQGNSITYRTIREVNQDGEI